MIRYNKKSTGGQLCRASASCIVLTNAIPKPPVINPDMIAKILSINDTNTLVNIGLY